MTTTLRGRFITLEGVDGAGKSTHLDWIADRLRSGGRKVLATREPGGTPLAEDLRALILRQPMDALTETLLIFAARGDHVRKVIAPALARGDWVVCDRFTDATAAYQGGGKGIDIDLILKLSGEVHGELAPDRTLVFDCPYEVARDRLGRSGRTLDRFEREDRAFFNRVREVYLQLGASEPTRVRIIDSTGSLDEIRTSLQEEMARI